VNYLLDVNVLIALLWTRHEHHYVAQDWFANASENGWATCSLTQLGFVRIVSNAAFSSEATRPAQALAVLKANIQHPEHQEWEDRWGAAAVLEPLAERLIGHRQVTDAYLLALVTGHGGRLVTLDRDIALQAVRGAGARNLVTIPAA